jgi:hypothetical protein
MDDQKSEAVACLRTALFHVIAPNMLKMLCDNPVPARAAVVGDQRMFRLKEAVRAAVARTLAVQGRRTQPKASPLGAPPGSRKLLANGEVGPQHGPWVAGKAGNRSALAMGAVRHPLPAHTTHATPSPNGHPHWLYIFRCQGLPRQAPTPARPWAPGNPAPGRPAPTTAPRCDVCDNGDAWAYLAKIRPIVCTRTGS